MIYDDGIQLNVDNKVVKCPKCGNSNIEDDEKYCSICGLMLYNECLSDNEDNYNCFYNNPGNARYCVYCGSETYFLREGILDIWKKSRDIKINRMEIEFDITQSSPKSSFLFEWDFILFSLEKHELITACLEKSKAKLISDELLVYLNDEKSKETLSNLSLGTIMFADIKNICKNECPNINFKEIILIAPNDTVEDIVRLDGIPF